MKATLDTRFLFALFSPASNQQRDWCRDVLRAATRSGSLVALSTVSVAEAFLHLTPRVGKDAVTTQLAALRAAGVQTIALDEELAERAGILMLETKDLPLADAAISATAIHRTDGLVLSDDPHFATVQGLRTRWVPSP